MSPGLLAHHLSIIESLLESSPLLPGNPWNPRIPDSDGGQLPIIMIHYLWTSFLNFAYFSGDSFPDGNSPARTRHRDRPIKSCELRQCLQHYLC